MPSIRATGLLVSACLTCATLAACGGAGDVTQPATTHPGGITPPVVNSVTIAGRPLLAVGDTLTLSATPLDAAGTPMTDRVVAWTSGSTQVASVDASTGLVRGVGVGSAVITAVIDGKSASVAVTVAAAGTDVTPPELVSLDYAPDSLDLKTSHDVAVSGRVTDVGSGAASFDIEFRGPTAASIECKAHAPTTGTPLDGTWSCTISVPNGVTPGPWTVEAVELRDANDNVRDVEVNELAARGFPTVITIH